MDKTKEICDAIISLNKYKNEGITDYEFIIKVCNCFDKLKNEKLSQADLKFMKYLSNVAGIPQYYDLLEKFSQDKPNIRDYDLNSLSSEIYESTLYLNEHSKIHKYQKKIIDKFKIDKKNRYFLSASTSFGKTHLVYDIIEKMKYSNVVLIFPTISLLSENLEKIFSDIRYQYFRNKYEIHTLSEVENIKEHNLFIYTPERFLSFIDKKIMNYDFVFIDEAYKLDNDYLIDEISMENERDVAYRLATYQALKLTKDILLAGPYIEIPKKDNNSFKIFLDKNNIEILDYNNYELVGKSYENIGKSKKEINIRDDVQILLNRTDSKRNRLIEILKKLKTVKENSILYCSGPGRAESYAKEIIFSSIYEGHDCSPYVDFLEHISQIYSKEWNIYKALKFGVGIHHGLVPKYIQKEIINLFNNGHLNVLVATTTITEGVNTSAKNLIILNDKKGNKNLKKFDAKNVAGRAGRFLQHYNGRVIILQNNFEKILKSEDDIIKHKNYDISVKKDNIDLFYTVDDFLTIEDKKLKESIIEEQQKRNLPDELLEQFKTINRKDKIVVYDSIKNLTKNDLVKIRNCLYKINCTSYPKIDWDGFQTIINCISTIVPQNIDLYRLINIKGRSNHSIIVYLLNSYLENGFFGVLRYRRISYTKEDINDAIRNVAKFVYNTLKYQLVKYIGVFNIMFRYIQSGENLKLSESSGIDRLLSKLEYNALTNVGRQISDYGVPSNVLNYYEAKEFKNFGEMERIKNAFDSYELKIFSKTEEFLKKEKDNND